MKPKSTDEWTIRFSLDRMIEHVTYDDLIAWIQLVAQSQLFQQFIESRLIMTRVIGVYSPPSESIILTPDESIVWGPVPLPLTFDLQFEKMVDNLVIEYSRTIGQSKSKVLIAKSKAKITEKWNVLNDRVRTSWRRKTGKDPLKPSPVAGDDLMDFGDDDALTPTTSTSPSSPNMNLMDFESADVADDGVRHHGTTPDLLDFGGDDDSQPSPPVLSSPQTIPKNVLESDTKKNILELYAEGTRSPDEVAQQSMDLLDFDDAPSQPGVQVQPGVHMSADLLELDQPVISSDQSFI